MVSRPQVAERSLGPQPAVDLRAVAAGVIITFLLTVFVAAVLAVGIYLTDVTEAHVSGALYYLGLVAIGLGSAAASKKAGTRGWLHGAATGFTYIVLSLLLGALVFPGADVLAGAAGKLVTGVIAGAIGGVVGINM